MYLLISAVGLVLILVLPAPSIFLSQLAPYIRPHIRQPHLRPDRPSTTFTRRSLIPQLFSQFDNVREMTIAKTDEALTFKLPPRPPPLFTHTPESIALEGQKMIEEMKSLVEGLVVNVTEADATWDSLIVPCIRSWHESSVVQSVIGFYKSVSGDQALREASAQAIKEIEEAGVEVYSRKDYFRLIKALYTRRDQLGLGLEEMRLLDQYHTSLARMGLELEDEKLARVKEISNRQTALTLEFQKTVNEEDGGVWFTPEQLVGLPADVMATLKKGEGEFDGKVKVSFKYPDIIPAMKFVEDADVRRTLYIAKENKCLSNVPLFNEMIVLRDEAARLHGYPNYAAYNLKTEMAKTPDTVFDFLLDIRQSVTGTADKEAKKLLALKTADRAARGLPSEDNLWFWDDAFYQRLMEEKEYQVDTNLVAEYLPLKPTVQSLLKIFKDLFGLEFEQLTEESKAKLSPTGQAKDLTWHEDVIMFAVWDADSEGGAFVGYLYLDLHPRVGKYSHAASFPLQAGFTDQDGQRHYPANALVCNFSKPTATKPSLLKHDEVVTLFHELGHGIHWLVSRTRYSYSHGFSDVTTDFVEAPSQMLEYWCWDPTVLRSMARHWQTGEPIPDDLLEKLIATKHVNEALSTIRQLQYGLFDMKLHTPETHQEALALQPHIIFNKMLSEMSRYYKGPEAQGEGLEWGHVEATFGHLMSSYAAGYYGYMWAFAFAADMFYTAFAKDPMDPATGRRYRQTILETGSIREEMDILVEFLGRKPNNDALYQELGITPKK